MDLRVAPCRTLCDWSPEPATGGVALFACSGCGSQWEPGQRWTPRQADGAVPAAVRAARGLSEESAGAAGSGGS